MKKRGDDAGCGHRRRLRRERSELLQGRDADSAGELPVAPHKGYAARGLSVERDEDVMKGTEYGSMIAPGCSFSSTPRIPVEHKADSPVNMPRGRPRLSQDKIELVGRWIDQGAASN